MISAWKRLTSAMDLAVLSNDEPAYCAAFQARERLGLDLARHPELVDWLSPNRCRCCKRLVLGGVCEDAMERAA